MEDEVAKAKLKNILHQYLVTMFRCHVSKSWGDNWIHDDNIKEPSQ